MFGDNPIRKPEKGDGTSLLVQNIFATFQGEGPYAGVPAIFLRLGGCNLACSFCDTEFESFDEIPVYEIITKINELAGDNYKLVVITGGEPFRQSIEKICDELVSLEYKVQIETNGTLYRDINDKVEIVCSPKNTGNGYKKIRPDLMERVTALKFIISNENKLYNHVQDVGQREYDIPVYVQPMDEYNVDKNLANLNLVKEMAMQNGYHISLQTHKIMGIE